MCPDDLPECANGRLQQQPPVADLSPQVPKAKPVVEQGTWSGVFLNPNSGMGVKPEEQGREMEEGTEADAYRHRYRQGEGRYGDPVGGRGGVPTTPRVVGS